MSGSDPRDDEDPFDGGFDFNDLGNLFNSLGGLMGAGGGGPFGGGDPWSSAEQIAVAVASEGGAEPNVDPIDRMAIENLARVAELHVRQLPGLELPTDTVVAAVSRSTWATESFSAYRPFFERFGEAMGDANQALVADAGSSDPMAAMFGQMFQSMGPMMVAASAGSMIGHLAQRTLGQYDLPVPRGGNRVLVVPAAIDSAAATWAVPVDELRLWVLVHELVSHAVLSTPHVRRQLEALFIDFAAAFRPNPDVIAEQIGDISDLSQLASIAENLGDPDTVLSMMRSPAHDLLLPQLDALVATVTGYIDHAVITICGPLVANADTIREALRQRAADTSPADRFMERLLGIDITESTLDRGVRFVEGVLERSDAETLSRLWIDELDLPTPAEVNAPGLWLMRIGVDFDGENTPDDIGGPAFEVPDDLSGLDDL